MSLSQGDVVHVTESLSLVMPVKNAQDTLESTVSRVLEVISELTTEFEVLIVDDDSQDATPEIADELTRRYPQLRLVPNNQQHGEEGCIAAGMAQAKRQYVLVHPARECPETTLRDLWINRDRRKVGSRGSGESRTPRKKALAV